MTVTRYALLAALGCTLLVACAHGDATTTSGTTVAAAGSPTVSPTDDPEVYLHRGVELLDASRCADAITQGFDPAIQIYSARRPPEGEAWMYGRAPLPS